MVNLQGVRKSLARYFTDPIVRLLAKTPVTPDALTWTGVFISSAAGALVALEHLFAAGWVVACGGLFDLLDGALARATNRATKFGAVLDSTLDRVSEAAVFIGLMVLYVKQTSVPGIVIVGVGMLASQLVSYIRARAEGIGINCEIGVFTRPERVVILSFGLLLSQFDHILLIALGLIAVLSVVTAGQRLWFVWQKTKTD